VGRSRQARSESVRTSAPGPHSRQAAALCNGDFRMLLRSGLQGRILSGHHGHAGHSGRRQRQLCGSTTAGGHFRAGENRPAQRLAALSAWHQWLAAIPPEAASPEAPRIRAMVEPLAGKRRGGSVCELDNVKTMTKWTFRNLTKGGREIRVRSADHAVKLL